MLALLSIKPVHAENIFAGRKTFEYRRKVFARTDVRKVLVYCTKPVARLVGEFDINEILQAAPRRLWEQTCSGSGISKQYFYDYFSGCKLAYALRIGDIRQFQTSIDPRDIIPNFSPPQSFMYLQEGAICFKPGGASCRM
jgi:predicted transcriptional regulator